MVTLRLSSDFIQPLPLSTHFLEVLGNYINYAQLTHQLQLLKEQYV